MLAVNKLVQRGRKQAQLSVKYQVPHCADCARSTKAIFLASLIPFGLGFILVGGLVFVVVVFGAMKAGLDGYGLPNNANSLVLGAALGLFAGILGAFGFEVLARILLLPVFGQGLLRAPLLSAQLLSDADSIAGLRGKPDQEGLQLELTFSNDKIASEFAELNAGLIGKNQFQGND